MQINWKPTIVVFCCNWCSYEGAKFAATMNEFVKTITELGENRRLEDLRCKE